MSAERGIIFSAAMARAILAGTKTQTRRLVRWSSKSVEADGCKLLQDADGRWWPYNCHGGNESPIACPYGAPGDRLWVRETWQAVHYSIDFETGYVDDVDWATTVPESTDGGWWKPVYAATDYPNDDREERGFPWRSPIFMPRWASRIDLEVKRIRVERLREITDDDARAEGVEPFLERYPSIGRDQRIDGDSVVEKPYRTSFACAWDEINGDRALFASDPWVWVVDFERRKPEISR